MALSATAAAETPSMIIDEFVIAKLIEHNYTIIKILGSGQQGSVILVTHIKEGIRYAAKVFRISLNDLEFYRTRKSGPYIEPVALQILTGVRANHVPRFKEFFDFQHAIAAYFVVVTDYAQGVPMDILTKERPPPSLDTVDAIITQFLMALVVFRQVGVAHRDIKLENVLLDPKTNYVTIIDFGLACIHRCYGIGGSPAYIDPRLSLKYVNTKAPDIDWTQYEKSDQFALGILLYRFTNGYGKYPLGYVPKANRALPVGFCDNKAQCDKINRKVVENYLVYDTNVMNDSTWNPPGIGACGHTAAQINSLIRRLLRAEDSPARLYATWIGASYDDVLQKISELTV